MAVIAALGCAALSTERAHANDEASSGSDPGVYVLVGALAVNAGLTIYNLATIGEDKPSVYGVGETVVAVPQVLTFGSIALMLQDSEDAWIPTMLAVWTAALATHGIYTLATGDEPTDEVRTSEQRLLLSFGTQF